MIQCRSFIRNIQDFLKYIKKAKVYNIDWNSVTQFDTRLEDKRLNRQ